MASLNSIVFLALQLLVLVAHITNVQSQLASPPPPSPPPPPPPPSPPPPPQACDHHSCPSGFKCKRNICVKEGGGGGGGGGGGEGGGGGVNCFPGDALVQTQNGLKPMKELSIGDKVVVGKRGVDTIYSDIYAFGHKDHDAVIDFVKIVTDSSHLELTPGHFVPARVDGKQVYKRAQDVKVGDLVNDIHGNVSRVTEISSVEKLGLFNPYTLNGNLIVNDILASSHSEWFLDGLFDAAGVSQWLPYAYQIILAPARGLYHILGNKVYKMGYDMLDSCFDIAEFGTNKGGLVALGVVVAFLMAASKPLLK